MATVIASFVVLVLVVAGMAIGVMMGRKPLKGSCGGMSSGTADTSCSLCGGNPDKCEEKPLS
ncbi:MAG: (Na+)-NQR maturation NqrM [Gammaproteobacteria bacterium]|nr:(Na+)-NQR maturation NqrM [Gammaproteobacteria bacterium]